MTLPLAGLLLLLGCALACPAFAQAPDAKTDPNATFGKFHDTPLMRAAYRNDLDEMQKLLAEGANANAHSDLGSTALYFAAGATPTGRQRNDAETYQSVKLLLEHGADVNAAGKAGVTPLMAAIDNALPTTVQLLIERGASLDARADDGTTVLMLAFDRHQWHLADLLLDHKADFNAPPDATGSDALMHAVSHRRPEGAATPPSFLSVVVSNLPEAQDLADATAMVERLAQLGARMDRFDLDGDSAFLKAARECHNGLMSVFTNHSADVNQKNAKTGQTALMMAAHCGDSRMIETLLEHHADPNPKDLFGKTALDYAREAGVDKIVQLLNQGK